MSRSKDQLNAGQLGFLRCPWDVIKFSAEDHKGLQVSVSTASNEPSKKLEDPYESAVPRTSHLRGPLFSKDQGAAFVVTTKACNF